MSTEKLPHLDVMLSSTTKDLPDHRTCAINAVVRSKMFPLAMEAGTAVSKDAIEYSLELVDQAEVYVGIFGYRYGYIPNDEVRNPNKISITEMEYRRAVERGIPILIFIMHEDHPTPTTVGEAKTFFEPDEEKEAKLKTLKAELMEKYVVGFFKSAEELRTLLLQSLGEDDLINQALAVFQRQIETGVKAEKPPVSLPVPPNPYFDPPYILTNNFIGRSAELRLLDEWAISGNSIMVVDAIGGMGKSALTWQWVNHHAKNKIPKLAGIMWWSFYEGGATINAFIRHALAYITRQDPDALKDMPFEDRVDKLLQELKRQPYLLVLDGLERILVAYHRLDAARQRDEEVDMTEREKGENVRACIEQRDARFLQRLVDCAPSKILISTRLMPAALEDAGDPIRNVQRKQLNGLHPDDAVNLMEDRGVKKANRLKLIQFMQKFGNHGLLLKMLAGRIKNYRRAPGDFDRWYTQVGAKMTIDEVTEGDIQKRILKYAFDGLSAELQKLLSQIAAFSDSVDYNTLSIFNPFLPPKPEYEPAEEIITNDEYWAKKDEIYALWDEKERLERQAEHVVDLARIEEEIQQKEAELREQINARERARVQAEKDYQQAQADYPRSPAYQAAQAKFDAALTELEERGLLQWERETDKYDLHPVIRAYAFDRLGGDDRKAAFNQIGDYFRSLPEKEEKPQELADIKNKIEIFRALMGAERLEEAANFFDSFLGRILGQDLAAYPVMVEFLNPFFPQGFAEIPALEDDYQQFALIYYAMDALNGISDYTQSSHVAEKLLKKAIERETLSDIANCLSLYYQALDGLTRYATALRVCQLQYEVSLLTGEKGALLPAYMALFVCYANQGAWEKAQEFYDSMLALAPELELNEMEAKLLNVIYEFFLNIMLFIQGKEVSAGFKELVYQVQSSYQTFLSSGLCQFLGEVALKNNQFGDATAQFELAVAIARKQGVINEEAAGLAGLARVNIAQRNHKEALALLNDSLKKGEPYNDAAEVYLKLGDLTKAQEYALQGYKEAWADGEPYVNWWELERAKKFLAELGMTDQAAIQKQLGLTPFDESKLQPIPYEAEIRALMEKVKAEREKEDEDVDWEN